jgi:hypothetical protein
VTVARLVSTCQSDNVTENEQARADLARVAEATQRVAREQARSLALGKAMTATLFAAMTLGWGLVEPLAPRVALVFGVLALVVVVSIWWARRERVVARPASSGPRLWPTLTAIAFVMVAAVGDNVRIDGHNLTGRLEYWFPAALIVAAPLLVSLVRGAPK